ncbi:MAG: TonB-dependent receptor [Haliscomenobacteraceae bacterium CHB4]|nr:Vitamin B12 transporter BtuB [Saprospiraceae bacterium]MCE7925754.1 TonB-dependent receptor [Haliscomenobacteraceae bacterium CHB4]
MKHFNKILIFSFLWVVFCAASVFGQATIRGKVVDGDTGEELIGAAVAYVGLSGGTITDYNGEFILKPDALPVKLKISYTGYTAQEIEVTSADQRITVRLQAGAIILEETVIKGQRIGEKQKAAPLTVENLDAIAIKETPAVSFYNGLGNLKGVDLTTASLGFTIINTRGFNSTSPVRSLQLIDGVDNQAPGLNFSLGNFLGAADLDVQKVDLIVGASSAFYGPNAFNGVISMSTKNPFIHKGLSVSLKGGERDLFEGALRWADAFKNKSGHDFMAVKINFFGLRAYDWVADNYDAVTGTETGDIFEPNENPGRRNSVNIYGDETNYVFTGDLYSSRAGLNVYHRTGYKEVDLVDYDTRNIKSSAALHFRTNPAKEFESPEIIIASSFGTGTTVYQGDNRFSLRDILFFQERIEFSKADKYFIRAYATFEDAGNSYDPYFTALKMQQYAKTDAQWDTDYRRYWVQNQLGGVFNKMKEMGYGPADNNDSLILWQQQNADFLTQYHTNAAAFADTRNPSFANSQDFFQPGTARFDSLFNAIISRKSNDQEGGTRFYDKSSLYHIHGEYRFKPVFVDEIIVGSNYRLYRPKSDGTVFKDTSGIRITNSEWGAYVGAEKNLGRFKLNATVRVDKNENFDLISTPAASVVWNPSQNNYLRLSFSAAIRNPTLADQYLNLNVGRATLIGNLDGFDSLITIESFNDYRTTLDRNKLVYNNLAPIEPEKVKTFELGYRTTLFNAVYVDAGYYFSIYDDFIGYNIGLTTPFDNIGLPVTDKLRVWRIASNASQTVTTQGIAIGLNYYFRQYFMLQGNYSWNRLNTEESDPIVPAFNTPEHKYNIGFSGRDLPWRILRGNTNWGFNINYKWIQGFVFEGSPQFTGDIPDYDLLDAQINCTVPRWKMTFKIGAANVLNNKQFQTYGGPRIGRMAYASVLYDFQKAKK